MPRTTTLKANTPMPTAAPTTPTEGPALTNPTPTTGMRRVRFEVILEAASPICHLAATSGNVGIINRRRIRQTDGGFAAVPEISGDAMRHGLREAAALMLLDASGITETPTLSEAALRLLFAGGMVTGQGDAGNVKLGEYRTLVDLVPSMALLGGCASNRTIPGRVNVEPATLICDESRRFLPAWVVAFTDTHCGRPAEQSCRASVEMVQRVRMDPTLDPGKRLLLDPGAADATERRLEASERASAEGNAGAKDAAKSSMMPRTSETLSQGSLFYWAVEATVYNDLDLDTFRVMFLKFLSDPIVGGKRAVGFGRLRVVTAQAPEMPRFAEPPSESYAVVPMRDAAVGARFCAHVAARKDALREFLKVVNA